ncbi:MAG: GMC family oxidoreductase [Bryobacteraceae bacterium]|nr:GMC family oxidoreductase [Bryobacteraceae bacterium]
MKTYDVAIIGSGAAGGMTAHVLTQAGLDCAMLEAGPMKSPAQFPVHRLRRWQLPFRGLRGDYFQEWLTETNFLANDAKEPYSVAPGGEPFEFWRVRAVGGKSLFWAGVTPRFGPDEFQPKDDFDARWPITYGDVAPYYDKVEELIGVSSTSEALGAFPLNKGLRPMRPKLAELEFAKVVGKLGRGLKMIPIPKAILTQDHRGRPACHHCGPCWQGCDSGSKFDSLRVFVLGARRTGKLDLLTGARVRSIGVKDGMAESVHYWDANDRTYREVRAKAVVLAAGCIESAQILLNSKIANSSGLVGRYLSEHLYASVGGYLPQLMGRKIVNEDGNGAHSFIPDLTANWRGNKFIRGYQIFPGGGIPETTMVGKSLPGYGAGWMKAVRDYYTAGVGVTFQGEVLPYRDNRIEIDETIRDEAGIPGVRFHYKWRENENAMFRDMMDVGQEMLRAAGAETLPNKNPKPLEYGHSIHYVGTARMGRDPKSSVVNPWNQSHDVKNLFLNDGAAFVTAGNQNPTITILALAMRSSERLAELMRRQSWE